MKSGTAVMGENHFVIIAHVGFPVAQIPATKAMSEAYGHGQTAAKEKQKGKLQHIAKHRSRLQ